MTWSSDLTAAPLDRRVWIATRCEKVSVTRWNEKRSAWDGLATGETPIAWQLYVVPTHPNFETHQRPSTNDEPSPEAGPQAEASPAGTGSGTLADREGRHEGEAVSVGLPTNHRSDGGVNAASSVAGHSPGKVSAPLSDREYVERIGDRVIAERKIADAAADLAARLGIDDCGGGV